MSLNERVAALPRALTLSPLCPHHLTLVVHIGNVVFVTKSRISPQAPACQFLPVADVGGCGWGWFRPGSICRITYWNFAQQCKGRSASPWEGGGGHF